MTGARTTIWRAARSERFKMVLPPAASEHYVQAGSAPRRIRRQSDRMPRACESSASLGARAGQWHCELIEAALPLLRARRRHRTKDRPSARNGGLHRAQARRDLLKAGLRGEEILVELPGSAIHAIYCDLASFLLPSTSRQVRAQWRGLHWISVLINNAGIVISTAAADRGWLRTRRSPRKLDGSCSRAS